MKTLQRLQFDTGEQISRKEYLKRKRKSSKLLRKRSKITYILVCVFVALFIYIINQIVVYRRYNNLKYTIGNDVESQAIYSIYYVTEGYTYDPVYSVSNILSSGKNEKSVLPSSDIAQISVTKDYIYGVKNNIICRINRDNYDVEEIVNDDVKKYIVFNDHIFYISSDDRRLKSYNISNGEIKDLDLTNTDEILANEDNVFGITHSNTEKSLYRMGYDGSNKEKITNDEKVSYAIIDNDTIYFVNKSDDNKIYRINVNSKDTSKVADIKGVADDGVIKEVNGSKYMFIKDEKLYYINTEDESTLWSYDLNTSDKQKIISSPIEILQNIDDTIFYKINKEMGVYLYNYNTKFMSLVTKRRVKEFVIDNYAQIPTEVKIENNYTN